MIGKRPRVYLADLRHTDGGLVANACMPLGMGYMKAVMDRDLPEVESRIFVYPEDLLKALMLNAPDVLMLSNYVWNEELGRRFTEVVKQHSPATLVVAGGPNIPLEPERQAGFFKSWKGLDVYALGEGDFLATEIVARFLDSGRSVSRLSAKGVPSSLFICADTVVRGPEWPKEGELSKIPSPWLSGVLDDLFDGRMIPLVETNRGCPFTCTYCVQGTGYYTRVSHFNVDRVKEELSYIANRIRELCPSMAALTIADPNYGMYERDVEISAHIGTLLQEYSWPRFIDSSTGKNAPERVARSIEAASGALVMITAVQSMNSDVLANIKRSNIKLESYQEIAVHLRARGLRSTSQTILGLPGETLESHVAGLHQLIDSGVEGLQNFQLMLLKGTEMESSESRGKYCFDTRFRVSPRCFGRYAGTKVFDMEEIVVSSRDLSFSDYVEARKHHLACMIFWNQGWFTDILKLALRHGIRSSQSIEALAKALFSDQGAAGDFGKEFVAETKRELFTTPEECRSYYSDEENYQKLAGGELAENLLNKYRAVVSFLLWPEVCELAAKTLGALLLNRVPDDAKAEFSQFFEDLCRFSKAKHAYGRLAVEILSPVHSSLQYNVGRWIADGHPPDPSPYRTKEPETYEFRLSDEGAKEIRDAMSTWPASLPGLIKVCRHLNVASQMRVANRLSSGLPEARTLP